MELFSYSEINEIIFEKFEKNDCDVLDYYLSSNDEKILGIMADHYHLTITVDIDGAIEKFISFVKVFPQRNASQSKIIEDTNFFYKETRAFELFKKFRDQSWHPKLLLLKPKHFVFEDMVEKGYQIPKQQNYLDIDEVRCAIQTIAKFHASTIIYEEEMSSKIQRKYEVWDDFSEILKEPPQENNKFRHTGVKAVIDFLIKFSSNKGCDDFTNRVTEDMPKVYDKAIALTNPSIECRNTIIHRDIWANNIFFKYDSNNRAEEAVLIDFQTVLYCPPLLDISSFLYLNTSREFREQYDKEVVELYYLNLKRYLSEYSINIENILPKHLLFESYEKSLLFGMTQASLIVPLSGMGNEQYSKVFKYDYHKIVNISRSDEIIMAAEQCERYKKRVLDICDEIFQTFILNKTNDNS